MRALAPACLVLLAGCIPSQPGGRCDSDADCKPTEQCIGGVCTDEPRACGASLPSCPTGQHCCGGVCSAGFCCWSDLDCPGGYCDNGTCRDGTRATCSESVPCSSGRCLLTTGTCVECIYTDDCASVDLVCSPEHVCAVIGAGCTTASCAAQGEICDADGTCRPCVSSAECGDKICASGTCTACTSDPECGLGRTCESGSCVNDPATECTSNADCGELFCNLGTHRCDYCVLDSECGPDRDCVLPGGTCSATDPDCSGDADCNPPTTICQAGLCTPGCIEGSCGIGQSCSPTTGRCSVISTGSKLLGEACTAHDECASAACWAVVDDSSGDIVTWCGKACMRHDDCPAGFVCSEDLGDGNVCVDKAVFYPGYPADVPPGGACSGTFWSIDCMTGYCNTTTGQCMQMCGRDADCADMGGGMICVLRFPVGDDVNDDGYLSPTELWGFAELCHPPLEDPISPIPETLDIGALCAHHDDCKNGYCAQTPNLTLPPTCAEACCTPHDCDVSRPICKPLFVYDGIRDDDPANLYGFQKVCLWKEGYAGQKLVGEPCTENNECRTEICVAGPSDPSTKRCTHTCCNQEDCADYTWAQSCRSPSAATVPPNPVADANYIQIRQALGRQAFLATGAPLGIAQAATTLCMPK